MKYTVVVRHPETDAPTALVKGTDVPDWATGLVHADDVESDGAPTDPRTVKELTAEIEARNSDRDEETQIKPDSAKKADLLAALLADDAAPGQD